MTHGPSVASRLVRDRRDHTEERVSTCACLQEGWAHGSQAGRTNPASPSKSLLWTTVLATQNWELESGRNLEKGIKDHFSLL